MIMKHHLKVKIRKKRQVKSEIKIQKIKKFIDKQKVSFVCQNYPNVKAMKGQN